MENAYTKCTYYVVVCDLRDLLPTGAVFIHGPHVRTGAWLVARLCRATWTLGDRDLDTYPSLMQWGSSTTKDGDRAECARRAAHPR